MKSFYAKFHLFIAVLNLVSLIGISVSLIQYYHFALGDHRLSMRSVEYRLRHNVQLEARKIRNVKHSMDYLLAKWHRTLTNISRLRSQASIIMELKNTMQQMEVYHNHLVRKVARLSGKKPPVHQFREVDMKNEPISKSDDYGSFSLKFKGTSYDSD